VISICHQINADTVAVAVPDASYEVTFTAPAALTGRALVPKGATVVWIRKIGISRAEPDDTLTRAQTPAGATVGWIAALDFNFAAVVRHAVAVGEP